MSEQLKLMILDDVVLGLLYVVSDYVLWSIVSGPGWSYYGAVAIWSPFYVAPTYPYGIITERPFIATMVQSVPVLNVPFLLFLVMFAANLYFIVKLGRKKETEQNLSQLV